MCHLEQTCLLPLQVVNGIFLLPIRWEVLLLWPLIKVWHHVNVPGLAPSTDCVMTWGDQLMLGWGMAWTPGGGKMWHSYAPEDLRIQLCMLVKEESLSLLLNIFPILLSPQFLEVSVGGFGMAVRWLPCSNLRIAFSTFPIWDCFSLPASQTHHGWRLIFHTNLNCHSSTTEMFIQFGKNCQRTGAKDNPNLDICSLEQ